MTKKLVLSFETEFGKLFNFTINEPKENLTRNEIETEANRLIASKVLTSKDGAPALLKGAKIVSQEVEEII